MSLGRRLNQVALVIQHPDRFHAFHPSRRNTTACKPGGPLVHLSWFAKVLVCFIPILLKGLIPVDAPWLFPPVMAQEAPAQPATNGPPSLSSDLEEQPASSIEPDAGIQPQAPPDALPDGQSPEGETHPASDGPADDTSDREAAPAQKKDPSTPDQSEPSDNKSIDQHMQEVTDEEEETPPLPSGGESRWDSVHGYVSDRILITAEWLDSFFDDERIEAEENRTTVKLRFDTDIEEGEGVDFRARARARLALPAVEERLSLVIGGDPDEDLQEGTAADEAVDQTSRDRDDEGITAALWYTLVDTYQRNVSMRVGARWRDSRPVLYLGPRYRQLWTFHPWAARYTWSVRWYTDVGWESRMRMDFERPLTRSLFFRQTTTYEWDHENDVTFKLDDGTREKETVNNFNQVGLSANIFQPLNRLSVLEYSTGVSFVNEPDKVLNNIFVLVKYRRQIWRKWLFFEVTPALNFPWIEDYEAIPSILFRIEAIFGRYE